MKRRFSMLVLNAVAFGLALGATPSMSSTVSAGPATKCTNDGVNCKVGDVGPGGGTVFYDAGAPQWWGRYLEAAPTWKVAVNNPWGNGVSIYTEGEGGLSAAWQRIIAKQIGMGQLDTQRIVAINGSIAGNAASRVDAYSQNGYDDWFLPSKDELDALYNYWKISKRSLPWFVGAPHWTSTEADGTFAWYQEFRDGTQFTDANGVVRGLAGNKETTKSPQHVGSNFVPMGFNVIPIRAFPASTGVPPAPLFVSTAKQLSLACRQGLRCVIGDTGPGGGIVFYDAGSSQPWGRYLEIAPVECESVGLPWRPATGVPPKVTLYRDTPKGFTAAQQRILAKAVGTGRANTEIIVGKYGNAANYAAKSTLDLQCGKDDWFLPSKDELDLAFNNLNPAVTPLGNFDKGYYWTSTEYNNETAWSQYFTDGQQFDRVKTLSANKTGQMRPFRTRAIRAFSPIGS